MPKQVADLRLRHARRYQFLRRATLTFSVAFTLLVPLWHLRSIAWQSAGLSEGSGWDGVASPLPTTAPPLVGAPWSADTFGLELLDPTAALGVAVTRVVDWTLLWAALPVLLLVLVLGRFFCGWLCPYLPILAVSNGVRALLTKLKLQPKDLPVPRRSAFIVLAVALVVTAVTGTQVVPLFYPPSIIGREVFRAVFFGGLGVGALLVAAAFLFDTFVSRAGFCRSLCPGGAVFSILGAASPVRIRRRPEACTDCELCDLVCNLGQRPMTDQVDSGCERCAKCVSVCPTDALAIGIGRPLLSLRQVAPAPESVRTETKQVTGKKTKQVTGRKTKQVTGKKLKKATGKEPKGSAARGPRKKAAKKGRRKLARPELKGSGRPRRERNKAGRVPRQRSHGKRGKARGKR